MVPVLRNVERMNYADIEKVNGCEIVSHLSDQLQHIYLGGTVVLNDIQRGLPSSERRRRTIRFPSRTWTAVLSPSGKIQTRVIRHHFK